MVKDELRKLLNQPYKSENWKKITEFVFPNVSYLQKPQEIPFESDKVESFKQIGNVKLSDGKNLAMFEVHVAENVNLASNRVELRKLVAPLIDQERNHGVLVIYEQGKEDYRFTFTAKSTEFDEADGDFKNVETDAKRFTYILGKNESCKTAANRFWELSSNKDKATIKDVEQAFSVERLNKEFFEKYRNIYADFVQHITGKRFEKEKGKYVEKTKGSPIPEHKIVFGNDDKLARNFVKLLLGRLVFIQFLQKKDWMGVPADSKKWKNGDKNFIHNLFIATKEKEKFHSDVLHDLFYKAFNTPNRPNDIFPQTGTRVPYLNGGLFENEYFKTELINFPSSYFQDLFDFFGQYNFTIDENDPMDHEVGIDPEMLGHIFENLLEDNKDKGAFYTPKPIVQYMCQESLIQYLKTYLVERNLWSGDEKKSNKLFEGIQNFVRKKIASAIIDFDEQIATALRDVKICDPAIGSGAFPMGLLNEIYYCMHVLYNASPDVVGEVWKMSSWQADKVKKNIIQNSIYGVDLEKGAVDIARLRFWLSLIVDEKEPYPLPNLEYKIVVGDSLSTIERDLFSEAYFAEIEELKPKYFDSSDPKEKSLLKSKIDNLIASISKGNKEFDYEVYFSDVFHSKGGFDIVIGNPPYINFENLPASVNRKKLEKLKTYTLKGDIYYLFCEKAYEIARNSGTISFIISNKWMRAKSGTVLRKFLSSKTINLIKLFDFDQFMIFESAIVHSNILIYSKSNRENSGTALQVKEKLNLNVPLHVHYDNSCVRFFNYDENIWNILNEGEDSLKVKVESIGTKLSKLSLKISYGIKTGYNEAFIIDKSTKESLISLNKKNSELIKPIVRGRDVRRYYANTSNLFMIIVRYHGANELKSNYPDLFKYLKKYEEPLKERGQVRNGQHDWLELDNNPQKEYLDSFAKPKIIFSEIVGSPQFHYDETGLYPEATTFFIQGDNLKILLALLNSACCTYIFKKYYAGGALVGKYRYKKAFLLNLPIPLERAIKNSERITALVDKIRVCIDNSESFNKYDEELDLLVCKLYNFDYSEYKMIMEDRASIEEKFVNYIIE